MIDMMHCALRPVRSRRLFVGAIAMLCTAVATVTGLLVWPTWQQHSAVARLIRAVESGSVDGVSSAVGDVRRTGACDIAAIELVKALLAERAVRDGAIYALGEIGSDAVAPLLDMITSHDSRERAGAARSLGKISPPTDAALLALMKALADPDQPVRRAAGSGLADLGPEADRAIPVLRELLLSPDPADRWTAAYALGRITESQLPAIESLMSATQDPDKAVRFEAIRALGELGCEASVAVPSLVIALSDEEKDVRMRAVIALEQMGPSARQAISALVRAMDQEEDPAMRYHLYRAVIRIDPKGGTSERTPPL